MTGARFRMKSQNRQLLAPCLVIRFAICAQGELVLLVELQGIQQGQGGTGR